MGGGGGKTGHQPGPGCGGPWGGGGQTGNKSAKERGLLGGGGTPTWTWSHKNRWKQYGEYPAHLTHNGVW